MARLETESAVAHTVLTEQLATLKETLDSQGIRVERIEVEINEELADWAQSDSDGSEEEQNEGQEQQNSRQESSEDSIHTDESHSPAARNRLVTSEEIDIQI